MSPPFPHPIASERPRPEVTGSRAQPGGGGTHTALSGLALGDRHLYFVPSGAVSQGWPLRPCTTQHARPGTAGGQPQPSPSPGVGPAQASSIWPWSLSLFRPWSVGVASPGSRPGSPVPSTGHGEFRAGPASPQCLSQALPGDCTSRTARGRRCTPLPPARTESQTRSPGSCGPGPGACWPAWTPAGTPWPCSSSRWRPGSSWPPRPCW